MLQFGASLTYDTSNVNYDRNVFIIQATGGSRCLGNVLQLLCNKKIKNANISITTEAREKMTTDLNF
jgi:hypothetical protein